MIKRKKYMDDRYLNEVGKVFNGFHFVDSHFWFLQEAVKQMKFFISLDFFSQYFIQADKQLWALDKFTEITYFYNL